MGGESPWVGLQPALCEDLQSPTHWVTLTLTQYRAARRARVHCAEGSCDLSTRQIRSHQGKALEREMLRKLWLGESNTLSHLCRALGILNSWPMGLWLWL